MGSARRIWLIISKAWTGRVNHFSWNSQPMKKYAVIHYHTYFLCFGLIFLVNAMHSSSTKVLLSIIYMIVININVESER